MQPEVALCPCGNHGEVMDTTGTRSDTFTSRHGGEVIISQLWLAGSISDDDRDRLYVSVGKLALPSELPGGDIVENKNGKPKVQQDLTLAQTLAAEEAVGNSATPEKWQRDEQIALKILDGMVCTMGATAQYLRERGANPASISTLLAMAESAHQIAHRLATEGPVASPTPGSKMTLRDLGIMDASQIGELPGTSKKIGQA